MGRKESELVSHKTDMVIKRYFTVSIMIILCFLSSFFLLFNGFSAIVQVENSIKKEIRYGYRNEVRMHLDSMTEIEMTELQAMAKEIDECNIYIDDLRIYFEECDYVYCPLVLLCINEKLPYPTVRGTREISDGAIWVADDIVHNGNGQLNIHGYTFEITDEIDAKEAVSLSWCFVLNAKDYFQAFEEEKTANTISLVISSNTVDTYETYTDLKDRIQQKYPDCYISYEEGERNSNLFDGLFTGKTILGILLYLFALINVLIISFYWVSVRKREVGIRKAYGATNFEIAFLLLKEMFLIISISAVSAFGIQLMIQLVTGGGMIVFEWVKIAFFYLGTIAISSLIAILIPVRFILKIHPAEGIKL